MSTLSDNMQHMEVCAACKSGGIILAACGPQLTLTAAQPKGFVAQQRDGARRERQGGARGRRQGLTGGGGWRDTK